MPRLLTLLALSALAASTAYGQSPRSPRAQADAPVASLCDSEPVCMATLRQRLDEHCGRNRACQRDALRQARDHRESDDLTALPGPVREMVAAIALRDHAAAPQTTRPEAPSPAASGVTARTQAGGGPPVSGARAGSGVSSTGESPRLTRSAEDGPASRRSGDASDTRPAPVQPASPYPLEGTKPVNIETTGISGSRGDEVVSLIPVAPVNNAPWLVGFGFGERSDDPCYFNIYYTSDDDIGLNYSEPDARLRSGDEWTTYINRCGSSPSTKDWLFLTGDDFGEATQTSDGEILAVTSVQVCQRRSNDLFKGIRLTGALMDIDERPMAAEPYTHEVVILPPPEEIAAGWVPELTSVPIESEFARTNCNEWAPKRSCSPRKVAIGVEVHIEHAGSFGHDRVTGLALVCATIAAY